MYIYECVYMGVHICVYMYMCECVYVFVHIRVYYVFV